MVASFAIFILAYGLAVYLHRLRKIMRRDAAGYGDSFGHAA